MTTPTEIWVPRDPDPALDRELLPKQLSPSRAAEFDQCPRKFFYGTVLRRPSPPTAATTCGTLMHYAAEHIFDRPIEERTVANAVALVDEAWAELTAIEPPDPEASTARHHAENAAQYRELAPAGSQAEAELLDHAREMVRRWYQTENVARIDPAARELELTATFEGKRPTPVKGIIDRVDTFDPGTGERLYLSDYKTSKKIPDDRFIGKTFRAMRTYAVLAEEHYEVRPYALRLVFVAAGSGAGIKTEIVTDDTISEAKEFMTSTFDAMHVAAETGEWEPKTSRLCDWCPFQPVCPAWVDKP